MAGDTTRFSGKGFLWESVLQGGGGKFFILVLERVGLGCILFSLILGSWVPFAIFVIIVFLIVGFSFYLASFPEGRLFFLDSNSFVRVIKMQMELMGDRSGKKLIGPRTQFVQPVKATDTRGAVIEGKVQ